MGTSKQAASKTSLSSELAASAKRAETRKANAERRQRERAEQEMKKRAEARYEQLIVGLEEALRKSARTGSHHHRLLRSLNEEFSREEYEVIRLLCAWAEAKGLKTYTWVEKGFSSLCDGYMPGSSEFGIEW